MKKIRPKELSTLLKPEGYNYVPVNKLRVGEWIRWYDTDARITNICHHGKQYRIRVIDPEGKEEEFDYSEKEELIVNQKRYN